MPLALPRFVLPLVVVVAALLAVSACAADGETLTLVRSPDVTTSLPPQAVEELEIEEVATIEELEVAGVGAVVLRPTTTEPAGTIVYFGGVTESAASLHTDETLRSLAAPLLDAGWQLTSIDADPVNWGNRDAVELYGALGRRLDGHVAGDGPALPVVLLARSMGGLASLTCVAIRCIPGIDAWIGIYPVTDQRMVAADLASQVTDAFGGPPPAELIPAENVGALVDVPMLLWASPEDTRVPAAPNGIALAAAAASAGGSVDLVVADGEHGHPSHFDARRILRFLANVGDGTA